MRAHSSFAAILFFTMSSACSAGKSGGGGTLQSTQDSGTTPGGDFDANLQVDGASGSPGTPSDCAAATKYVYVLDQNNTLFKFDPTIKSMAAFTSIGTVNCGAGTQPNSMAIARDGTAYVDLMNGGSCQGVYKVDITNANCKGATPFACGTNGFGQFGMGYSTNAAGSTQETLYIGNTTGADMASLDPATGQVHAIGSLPVGGPEFTGNANGELWAFMPQGNPPKVAQIDKTTAKAIKSFDLSALSSSIAVSPSAWAFAFWGGDYYIFLQGDLDTSTNVWQMTPTGSVTEYIADTGMTIVGAGVSTCAPLSIQ